MFNSDGSSVKLDEVKEVTTRGTVSLPLVGRVAAGLPILAEQNVEDTFTLPTEIATDSCSFILEVHGDSMINVGIYNGDYIVVREQKSAMNGGNSRRHDRRGSDRQDVLQGTWARASTAGKRFHGTHLRRQPHHLG